VESALCEPWCSGDCVHCVSRGVRQIPHDPLLHPLRRSTSTRRLQAPPLQASTCPRVSALVRALISRRPSACRLGARLGTVAGDALEQLLHLHTQRAHTTVSRVHGCITNAERSERTECTVQQRVQSLREQLVAYLRRAEDGRRDPLRELGLEVVICGSEIVGQRSLDAGGAAGERVRCHRQLVHRCLVPLLRTYSTHTGHSQV
jgi:hypothetical protein